MKQVDSNPTKGSLIKVKTYLNTSPQKQTWRRQPPTGSGFPGETWCEHRATSIF